MDETGIAQGTNSLSYLIPTGLQDLAVREWLIPIFGDAISCKVPGAPCGVPGDTGKVAAVLFETFNGGTLVFVTILLIFIGLMAFIKTAQDGEFMGKSWNTTFTALRLLVGVAFILPMPNSYSTIQNFALYVTLWSSGLGNQANEAVADHYLKRLADSMVNQQPNATTVRNEAQDILSMHTCASLTNKLYPGAADLQFKTTTVANSDRVEYAYVEYGTYLMPGSAPCGRLVVKPLGDIQAEGAVPTEGVWNAALGGDPLTANARKKMADAAKVLSADARAAKIRVVTGLMSNQGPMRLLADQMVDNFAKGVIQYDATTGAITQAPESSPTGRFTQEASVSYVKQFATIVRAADAKLNGDIETARKNLMSGAKNDGSGSFLSEAREMLRKGGWMASASTYRTMLDMVSIQFVGDKQSPFKLEGRDEILGGQTSSSGGIATQIASIRSLTSRMLDSDTGKQIITSTLANDNAAPIGAPSINEATIEKLATGKLSTGEIMEVMYGTNTVNGYRNGIMKAMTVSGDYDPLYQMKAIGDLTTNVAEAIVGAELVFRVAVGVSDTVASAAEANVVGWVANKILPASTLVQKAVQSAKYVAEQVFSIMRTVTFALVALGYMFSSWLPAVPFLAFLLAQMGWLFGALMSLFALNIWAVMHTTPARNDSFIGSEAQGYLLLVAMFFRPIIAVSALSLSYVIAPPVMKVVNMTLLPMMYASNVSTNALSVITATIFCLILYFTVVKAVLIMVYMIPQSFPDEVMRIISAGIGDLGQSRALSTMETSDGTARTAVGTLERSNAASGEAMKANLDARRQAKKEVAANAASAGSPGGNRAQDIGGAASTPQR